MPQLILKGIEIQDVKLISKDLVDELQEIIECPRDYLTLEVSRGTFIADGEEISTTPMIQVNWFDRGQAIQDLVAAAITRHIQQAGYSQVEIFFNLLEKHSYYENGEHY